MRYGEIKKINLIELRVFKIKYFEHRLLEAPIIYIATVVHQLFSKQPPSEDYSGKPHGCADAFVVVNFSSTEVLFS